MIRSKVFQKESSECFESQIIEYSYNGVPFFYLNIVDFDKTVSLLEKFIEAFNQAAMKRGKNFPIEVSFPYDESSQVFHQAYLENKPVLYAGRTWLVTRADIVPDVESSKKGFLRDTSMLAVTLMQI